MENLISQLKKDAIDKGLCAAWQAKFKDTMSIPSLVRMYVRGIDFCISEDFPTLDFLRSKFKGVCEPYGVFVDSKGINLTNASDVVLNGSCEATLEYNSFTVSRLYVRHNSVVKITVSGNACVTIDAFDDSTIKINASAMAKVFVSQYGKSKVEATHSYCSRITINKMDKLTY